jgi:peptidoglycan/xylan/chitin deacetylase (PgdA/CDA1 family)
VIAGPDVLVLCYHGLGDAWDDELSVRTDELEAQVRLLLDRGYEPSTFSDAVRRPRPRTLAVTFDDGYRSVLDEGLPVLERLGVPATIFVPSSYVGSGRPMDWPGIAHWATGPNADALVPLGWDELGELQERGWEIGSHTCSHPRLTTLGDAELEEELTQSRIEISERMGSTCDSIAYPYGDVDLRVIHAADAAGYLFGAALPKQLFRGIPLLWPRVGIYRGQSMRMFRGKVSPAVRSLRSIMPGGPRPRSS